MFSVSIYIQCLITARTDSNVLPAMPVNPICLLCRYFTIRYKVKHYVLLFFHLLIRNELTTMFALSPIIISGTAGNMGFMKCLVRFFDENFVVHCISVFKFNFSYLLSALHKAPKPLAVMLRTA
jgi:hypothetical protein